MAGSAEPEVPVIPLIFSASKGVANADRLAIRLEIDKPVGDWSLFDADGNLLADNAGGKVAWVDVVHTPAAGYSAEKYEVDVAEGAASVSAFVFKGECRGFTIKPTDIATGVVTIEQFGELVTRHQFNTGDNTLVVPDVLPAYITSLMRMFAGASTFNQDISEWDTSNITDMYYAFSGASSFNQNISAWNVSKVTDMYCLFEDAISFNQDISGWDVSAVTDMAYMFAGTSTFNQDISGWDTSSVEDMDYMFNGSASFNQNISLWNTALVEYMDSMFEGAILFNQDLSKWCVPLITTAPDSFALGATAYVLPKPVWGTCPRGEDALPA